MASTLLKITRIEQGSATPKLVNIDQQVKEGEEEERHGCCSEYEGEGPEVLVDRNQPLVQRESAKASGCKSEDASPNCPSMIQFSSTASVFHDIVDLIALAFQSWCVMSIRPAAVPSQTNAILEIYQNDKKNFWGGKHALYKWPPVQRAQEAFRVMCDSTINMMAGRRLIDMFFSKHGHVDESGGATSTIPMSAIVCPD